LCSRSPLLRFSSLRGSPTGCRSRGGKMHSLPRHRRPHTQFSRLSPKPSAPDLTTSSAHPPTHHAIRFSQSPVPPPRVLTSQSKMSVGDGPRRVGLLANGAAAATTKQDGYNKGPRQARQGDSGYVPEPYSVGARVKD
jgi:hypothetical protein